LRASRRGGPRGSRAVRSKDKRLITFKGMKHETLNERSKAAAYKEVLGWLGSR